MKKISICLIVLFFLTLATIQIHSYSFLDVSKDVIKNQDLYEAAFIGDIERIKILVEQGANINTINSKGRTPIMAAVYGGHKDIVEFFISKGASLSKERILGNLPLRYLLLNKNKNIISILIENEIIEVSKILYNSIAYDQEELVGLALKKGVLSTSSSSGGYTLLMEACRNGSIKVAKKFLENGAKINDVSNNGKTALHEAILSGDINLVRLLVTKGADRDLENEEGLTSVQVAEKLGYKGIIKILQDPSIIFPNRGKLVNAVTNGYLTKVRYLLNQGGYINTRDDKGNSLVMLAAKNNKYTTLEYLLDKGANVNLKTIENDGSISTALLYAVENGNLDMVDTLLAYGADPDIGWLNKKPIIQATYLSNNNAFKILEVLLEYGADTDIRDKNDFTPLMCLVAGNIEVNGFGERIYKDRKVSIEVIKNAISLLFTYGLQANEKNYEGTIALMLAVERNNKELIKLLLENGAAPTIEDNYGNSSISIAKEKGFKEIEQLLKTRQ